MSKSGCFVIEMENPTKEQMDALQEAMNKWCEAMVAAEQNLAKEFGISESCAANVLYLRSRSRWTQELENELIRMDKAGEPEPNMCEWPPDVQ